MIKTVLKIDGMMCEMCESHVNDAVRNTVNVKKVSSSHKKGETEILSEENLNVPAVTAAIEKTGYRVLDVRSEPYEKKGFFSKLMK